MRSVSRHRWRALPTILVVLAAIALGAATARAGAPAARGAGGAAHARR